MINFQEKIDTILRENTLNIRTLPTLTEFLGINYETVRRYYNGGKEPTVKITKAIIQGLDINYQWWRAGQLPIFLNDKPEHLLKRQIKLQEEIISCKILEIAKLKGELEFLERENFELILNTKYL